MTKEEMEFIYYNGINPYDTTECEVGSRKDLFDKLTNEYRQAFLKKFGESALIDGYEVFSYGGELYLYCQPFGDGQYARHFTFGVGVQEGRMGKYDEYASSDKKISIPCQMCTEDRASVFPVIKAEFKIEDGKVKLTPAKELTIITTNGKTQLNEDEKISVFDEDIIISSLGFRSAKSGELLIEDNAAFKSYSGDKGSIRTSQYVTDPNPKYYPVDKLKAFLRGRKVNENQTTLRINIIKYIVLGEI